MNTWKSKFYARCLICDPDRAGEPQVYASAPDRGRHSTDHIVRTEHHPLWEVWDE